MLRSMTGFGLATVETDEAIIRVEIKSLNSKGLDLLIKAPKAYSEKEISLRSFLSPRLERGKTSIYIDVEYTGEALADKLLNKELLISYYQEIKALANQVGETGIPLLPAILNQGEIYNKQGATELDEQEWSNVEKALNQALQKFEQFRNSEGKSLAAELKGYITNIKSYLTIVDAEKAKRLEKMKAELREKLSSFIADSKIDENRFEQELIYYAEKLDITEEIVRLGTHLDYFIETMEEASAGKKLGFIAQEIGREINTIGSKANDAGIQKTVVKMKEELEKIKEQVLNVL